MTTTTLKERLDMERGERKPSEVHELILDTSHGNLDVLTDEYDQLELLSLVGCSLSSLKGLGKLPKLRRLELSENKFEDGLDLLVEACPALVHLNLSGNKISKVETLKALGGLKHLTHLDLFNCPVTEEGDEFRNKVFEMLPRIIYLDGTNRDGEDEPDDDSEGDDLNDDDVEEDDEDDFEGGNEEDEDEEEEEDEEEPDDGAKRGTKRKHREEEDEDDDDDDGGDEDDE